MTKKVNPADVVLDTDLFIEDLGYTDEELKAMHETWLAEQDRKSPWDYLPDVDEEDIFGAGGYDEP